MKKLMIALAGVCATILLATSCNNPTSGNVKLSTAADSAAYALGILNGDSFGRGLATYPGDSIDVNILLNGFAKGIKGQKTQMTLEEANEFMQTYFQRVMEKEANDNLKKGQEFLSENGKKEGVVTTGSGLQYKVETLGDGIQATSPSDTVVVHYEGLLLDGTKFDSSYDRGEPATFPLDRVIAGWTEGMQLVPAGTKFTLWIPADLGYGMQGSHTIGPNETLQFNCELIEVRPAVAAE